MVLAEHPLQNVGAVDWQASNDVLDAGDGVTRAAYYCTDKIPHESTPSIHSIIKA